MSSGSRWRCGRCGHEVTVSAELDRILSKIPRCHACETREELYPNGPKIWAPLPMTEVR